MFFIVKNIKREEQKSLFCSSKSNNNHSPDWNFDTPRTKWRKVPKSC